MLSRRALENDPANSEIRKLRDEIREAMQKVAKESAVENLLLQAEILIARRRYNEAIELLEEALRSGETLSLPAAVRIEAGDAARFAAIIKVDARSLKIESSERAGLNFSIVRANLGRVDIVGNGMIISGHAEFYGRTISPRLHVTTDDLETIRTLLTEWQK